MFRFGTGPTVNISFGASSSRVRKQVKLPGTDAFEELLVYGGNEPISGSAEIIVPAGKKVDHLGIKVEMIGQIELYFDRGNYVKFTALVRELEPPGVLTSNKTYAFDFNTEKPYETYSGMNTRLRYFLRVTITKNYNNSFTKEQDFLVHNVTALTAEAEAPQAPLKMEVGIEDCLHIEFEYDRQRYHLQDVVQGKIYFLLVRIKIKHMELAVIRRETAGSGSNTYNESENITKFELMDGAPVKGECVPIRLYLKPLTALTPTYRSVNNVFSVKYYLNLVLIDEEDRRYFKQQEVILWRKEMETVE